MEFASRMAGLDSAIFTELELRRHDLAQRGVSCINFSIGTPDLPPDPHLMSVLAEACAHPKNYRYAICDLPELVEAVQYWYRDRYQVSLPAESIQSLMGSQEGLAHIALTLANPGDVVLTPDPGYPIFNVGPQMASARVVPVPLRKEEGWRMDLDSIPATVAHAAKLIVTSYPNNPTSSIAPEGFYEHLIWFAKKYDIVVLHDNAYSELTYDGVRGGSFLSVPGAMDVGIEFNSMSKSWNVPGCRVSFALGKPEIIAMLRLLKSHLDYGLFLPFQRMAIAALTGPRDCVEHVRANYESRRDVLVSSFAEAGWTIPKPSGTMFVWAPLPGSWTSSIDFVLALLEQTGILVVPGISFGQGGEGYVRIALVNDEAHIREAAARIAANGIARC